MFKGVLAVMGSISPFKQPCCGVKIIFSLLFSTIGEISRLPTFAKLYLVGDVSGLVEVIKLFTYRKFLVFGYCSSLACQILFHWSGPS